MPKIILLLSVNLVKSGIGTENLRNDDSIRSLIVFKQRSYYSWQRKRTTVKRMRKLRFTILITISQMKTVGLICLEIGH